MGQSPIRVAVIGTGFGGKVQIPGFALHPEIEIVSVCSSTLSRAQLIAQEFGVPHFTDDYRASIAHPKVDLVSIATPPHQHTPMVLAALKARKHVLCEKPFALNAKEAQRMARAAKKARRAGMLDHEFRYLPVRQRLKELIDDGWLGDLQRIVAVEGLSWMSSTSTLRHHWQSEAKLGGGLLGALGSHYVDFCRWVAGEVVEVDASLGTLVKKRRREDGSFGLVDVDDNLSLRLKLTADVIASIEMCATTNAQTSAIYVMGSKGTLHVANGTLLAIRAGRDPVTVTAPSRSRRRFPENAHPLVEAFYCLVSELVKKVRGEESNVPTFDDGLRVQQVMDAARRSARTGRSVSLARRRAKRS